ncbi:MAG: alpha/beta hydrolase [Proteobacteria bacterium]|nr:MAG: alpha/beta hydrolase [Pseudomonadota bacterium]
MSDSSRDIFELVRKTAAGLGACDPQWLRNGDVPDFKLLKPNKAPEAVLPPMVLLHGLFGALSNWDSTLELFAGFTNPVALEFPILTGHRSEVKVKALSVFTELFIRTNKLQPVTLCGNSLGGHVALRLCLAVPELVDCLILSGASGLYEHSVDALPVRPDKTFVRDHMARVFFSPKFITDQAVDEIHNILTKRTNVLNLIHAARSAKKDNLLHVLKQIKVPTLLLWGEDDQVTTMQVAETFHKNIPNSELVSVKNCGHAPMIEHPEWFSAEVQKFLKKNSKAASND